MSRLWMTFLLIVAMVTQSLNQTVSSSDSTCGCTDSDGKLSCSRPKSHPVNIQIGGDCTSAIDELLNVARTMLNLLQNMQAPSCIPAPSSTPEPSSTPTPVSDPPRDCSEIQAGGVTISGVYPIYPDGASNALDVYCDMDTDGGGWTVFQRRQDGSVDFFLGWTQYKYGFGNVSGEHWLGNENIHRLSTQKTYELRVDLEDFEGESRYASYSSFNITDEVAKYKLTIGDYSGDAGDSLIHHQGQSFTTRDRDNDPQDRENCAVTYSGAWWYGTCHYSNLNGLYLNGTTTEFAKGVVWDHWLGYNYSLKKTEMKIRPV